MVALPTAKRAGILTAAIGLSAALTALRAFTIPAPQVPAVQAHSALDVEPATHCANPVGCGNGVALAFKRAMSWGGVRFAFAARMSAAMPETMGAEKLVPRLVFAWSVYALAPGTVAPSLIVESIERRHGPPFVFTQLPAGAAIPTSGPRLL